MKRQIYVKTDGRQLIIDRYHIDPESEITEVIIDNQDMANVLNDQCPHIDGRYFLDILEYGYPDWPVPYDTDDLYQGLSIETEEKLENYAKEVCGYDEDFDEDVFARLLATNEELRQVVTDSYTNAWLYGTAQEVIDELESSLDEATQELLADDDLSIRALQAHYEYSPKYAQVVASFKTEPLISLIVNNQNNEYDFDKLEELTIYYSKVNLDNFNNSNLKKLEIYYQISNLLPNFKFKKKAYKLKCFH